MNKRRLFFEKYGPAAFTGKKNEVRNYFNHFFTIIWKHAQNAIFKLIFQNSQNPTKLPFFSMFSWFHNESKISASTAQISLEEAQNIFPKSYGHDKHESNAQYFVWGAILKNAPFLFENSMFFTKKCEILDDFSKNKRRLFV